MGDTTIPPWGTLRDSTKVDTSPALAGQKSYTASGTELMPTPVPPEQDVDIHHGADDMTAADALIRALRDAAAAGDAEAAAFLPEFLRWAGSAVFGARQRQN
jgi:hypothetical protein